jgi:UDP-N-acetylglucosamine acyltransferase
MPTIHSPAILTGEIELADDVVVGPHCVLNGSVKVGAGCKLVGNVYLQGPLTIGAGNTMYPFVCLGFAPQDLKWKPDEPGAGLVIGEGNVFREHVTIHRATSREIPTRIGDKNFFMASSHAGHDCRIGNAGIFANGVMFGGHVRVDDRVIVGGASGIHQFCRIGRGCMISGAVGTTRDLPPFFTLTGINTAGSINIVGLRRSGAGPDVIDDVKWVYRTLYRRGLSIRRALDVLREREDRPMVREYIDFIENSKRGICPAVGTLRRSAAGVGPEVGSESDELT